MFDTDEMIRELHTYVCDHLSLLDDDSIEQLDFRVQIMEDRSYNFWFGDIQYDTDSRGSWGYGSIDRIEQLNCEVENVVNGAIDSYYEFLNDLVSRYKESFVTNADNDELLASLEAWYKEDPQSESSPREVLISFYGRYKEIEEFVEEHLYKYGAMEELELQRISIGSIDGYHIFLSGEHLNYENIWDTLKTNYIFSEISYENDEGQYLYIYRG
jgi:hypothetical protein